MKNLNICIAGLGNVGSAVVGLIDKNSQYIKNKSNLTINIIGLSAKNKDKERNFNVRDYKWIEDPIDLLNINDLKPDILIELIGYEKGLSYELVKTALNQKINVVTGNKAMLAMYGQELFRIADENQVSLLFEAAVAGGIPIIKTLKNNIFLNKVKKISGILNGTTNYILTTMETQNKSFEDVLNDAKKRGFTSDNESKLDIGGYDAAHKLTLLSTIAFGGNVDFNLNKIEGIENITIEDINFVKHLGFRIKLISESFLINDMICSSTKPKLIPLDKPMANVDGALNAINVETDQLENLYLQGEGAGGLATASSILSDIFEISNNSKFTSIGYNINDLKKYQKFDSSNLESKFYLRIRVKDQPGVLSKITTYLNDSNISVEKILQTPDKKENNIPILIITHKIKTSELLNSVNKISDLDFVNDNISIIPIE